MAVIILSGVLPVHPRGLLATDIIRKMTVRYERRLWGIDTIQPPARSTMAITITAEPTVHLRAEEDQLVQLALDVLCNTQLVQATMMNPSTHQDIRRRSGIIGQGARTRDVLMTSPNWVQHPRGPTANSSVP